jgi:serine/threonine-protein kinase
MAVGLRIGRYELGERIGTGGFGVVYHARDTELGRELAIKVLRPEYQSQPDVVARFLKEARAAAQIDHPGIVTVFECGTINASGTAQDGNAYIAMELLRGYSLTQHLEQKKRLPVAEAILIARQVAAALAVAHASGIVHRDLKPDNVFLLPDPLVKGGFRIKILDFGVAKLAEPKEVGVNTHSQVMLGTPKYMSPEQARSARAVDRRTDIYMLGCMLYEMVTGKAPYDGPGAIDMIIQHTTSPIPSPAAIVHDLLPEMDELIRTMLAKEPDQRPESMLVIDQALETIQADVMPSSAPRPKPASAPPPLPTRPSQPPPRPTPPPPMRPTPHPVAETLADSSPFTAVDELPTHPERFSRTQPTRNTPSNVPIFIVAGVIAAGLAALIVWFVLRKSTPSKTEIAKPTPEHVDVAKLRKECQELERTEFWKELKDCADHLKPLDAPLGEQLWKKADDEAANEKKFAGIKDYIEKGELGRARDLVKRIGEGSVYTRRAHEALEKAEAKP